MIAKLARHLLVLMIMVGIGYFLLPHLFCIDLPKRQKLAELHTNTLAVTMTCDNSPPYQFVLGLDSPQPGPFTFSGEITIRQSTRTVARIPINSDLTTPCNWVPGLDAHILTWNRTNAGERLGGLLHRGQTYDLLVTFTEPPPTNSSLWFSSMGKAKVW